MLAHLPLAGELSILRPFGRDADLFGQLQFQNRPLLGHNGIDMTAPPGSPVHAVQAGTILRAELQDSPNGFGGYVLLGHNWGQTLYARLRNLRVREGEQIRAGTVLGEVANRDAPTPSHLHFGLRLIPYSLDDGWAGYVDPQPYLERIAKPLGPIIGPHIIAAIRPHLPLLAQWQPRMILLLDPHADEVRELRQVCPDATLIARVYHPDHEIEQRIRSNPQHAAEWAHERIMARWSPDIDYWQFPNELLQDQSGLSLLSQFELYRMQIAQSHGYKCAILAFSVGNPDLPPSDRMAHWRLVYPALQHAEAHGHIVAVHQYGMPGLWGPDNAYDWYIHRLEHQVLRRLPFKKLKFAVTEYGIDGLIQGGRPAGWQTFTTPENYAGQLLKAARYLERFSGRVLGYAIFTLGHYMPWSTYDIAGPAAEMLARQLARGVWADIDTHVPDIAPHDSDFTVDPGPEALPSAEIDADEEDRETEDDASDDENDGDAPDLEPDDEPESEVDENDSEESKDEGSEDDRDEEDDNKENEKDEEDDEEDSKPPGKPNIQLTRRLSPWAPHFNISYTALIASIPPASDASRRNRPADGDPDDLVFLVKDIFTTRNGSWEPDDQPGSITPWARADYLRPLGAPDFFDDAGADHHLFAAVIGLDGELLRSQPILFWSDGLEQVHNPAYAGYVRRDTKSHSGWANIAIGPGSGFVPERGESGPWCWAPAGAAEVACGGGLPANHHISTFVVWQAVRRGDLFPPTDESDEPPDDDIDDNDQGNDTGENDGEDDNREDEDGRGSDYTIYIPVVIR